MLNSNLLTAFTAFTAFTALVSPVCAFPVTSERRYFGSADEMSAKYHEVHELLNDSMRMRGNRPDDFSAAPDEFSAADPPHRPGRAGGLRPEWTGGGGVGGYNSALPALKR